MIDLMNVTDVVRVGKIEAAVAIDVSMQIPRGRYVMMAPLPQVRRPAIDVLCGARPPKSGAIGWSGRPSWPIARAGFVRGRLTGFQIIELIAGIYQLDRNLCIHIVEEMLSFPRVLGEHVLTWDALSRQEFGHTLALIPVFDTYFVDGALPSRRDSFTRKWRELFEQRIEGKTFILAAININDCKEFCDRALILDDGRIEIGYQVDECLDKYPLRAFEAGPLLADPERELDELF